jgi:hypothetical protein
LSSLITRAQPFSSIAAFQLLSGLQDLILWLADLRLNDFHLAADQQPCSRPQGLDLPLSRPDLITSRSHAMQLPLTQGNSDLGRSSCIGKWRCRIF